MFCVEKLLKILYLCIYFVQKGRNWFHKNLYNPRMVGHRKLPDPSLNHNFNALSIGVQYLTPLSDSPQLVGIPSSCIFGTESYVFQNQGASCNDRVQEEETKRQIFCLMCRGGWCADVQQVVNFRLMVVCSHFFVVCGHLWSVAGGLWWFVIVCGRLQVVCDRLWSFVGGLWWFVVVACFRNYARWYMGHEIRNELDIIFIHAHFSRNLKTSILKASFFLRLAFFQKVKSVWNW